MKRITWSDSQKKRLVDEVERICKSRNIMPPFANSELMALVRQAQSHVMLPAEEKEVTSSKAWQWVEQEVMERLTAPVGQEHSQLKTVNPSLWEYMRQKVLDSEPVKNFVNSIVDDLFDQVQREVNKRLEAAYLPDTDITPAVKLPQGTPLKVARLPRVVVVGLLPDQADHIRRNVRNVAEVIGLKDDMRKYLVCKNADLVIMATGFISHTQDAKVRKLTDKWERIPGEITRITEFIMRRYPAGSESTVVEKKPTVIEKAVKSQPTKKLALVPPVAKSVASIDPPAEQPPAVVRATVVEQPPVQAKNKPKVYLLTIPSNHMGTLFSFQKRLADVVDIVMLSGKEIKKRMEDYPTADRIVILSGAVDMQTLTRIKALNKSVMVFATGSAYDDVVQAMNHIEKNFGQPTQAASQ